MAITDIQEKAHKSKEQCREEGGQLVERWATEASLLPISIPSSPKLRKLKHHSRHLRISLLYRMTIHISLWWSSIYVQMLKVELTCFNLASGLTITLTLDRQDDTEDHVW